MTELPAAPASLSAITFRLGDDHFAADVSAVERVLRYARPAAVPGLPAWIDGVLDHDGTVLPVIDLRSRLGLERREAAGASRVIIFATDAGRIGVTVDAVMEVTAFAAGQIAPPPPLFRGLAAAYLRGLVRRGERVLILLDMDRLLSATEQLELVGAAANEAGDA